MSIKRIACVILAVILISGGHNISAADNISIFIDGQRVNYDVQPMIIANRSMVPFRLTCEKLGASVAWDQEKQIVRMILRGRYADVTVGSTEMNVADVYLNEDGIMTYANLYTVTLEAAPVIVNSRVLVPARAISEALGATVKWISQARTVLIITSVEGQD